MYYISINSWGSVDPFGKSKAEEARTVIKPDKNNRVRRKKNLSKKKKKKSGSRFASYISERGNISLFVHLIWLRD